MFKKSVIFIFLCLVCFTNTSFGYNKAELNLAYNKFYTKLEKSLGDNTKIIANLEKLDLKISNLVLKTKSSSKVEILNDLLSINKSKITSLKIKKIKQNVEENIVNNTPFISELIDVGYKNITLNDALEYLDNGTYRFVFKKYYEVNKSNYKYFIENKLNNGYIVRYKGNFLVTNDYKIEKKYSYLELYTLFNNKADYRDSYILINGEYYTYKYNYYLFFDQVDGLYLSDLAGNKITLEKTLLIRDIDGKYLFSNDYKKIRLVSEKVIKDITNKKEFLYNVLDDNRNFENNYDDILLDIKDLTISLIKNKNTSEEKTKAIYKWVVDNIVYYKDYNDGNKQVFSGILTYKNKSGVCDGYTKIFSYMLSFAGVDDVEIKRGFAFDSIDFPNFGHAWLRIGNYYYDPTFDDPVGNTDLDKNLFLYYKLPYDLIYVNRFDGVQISKEYNGLDLATRKKIVLKNMYSIYEKYNDYQLMSKIKNRLELGLKYDDDLTLDILKEKIPFYEVNNGSYYDENGNKYMIAGLSFYSLNNTNLDNVLFDAKVDIKNSKMFKWYDKNGNLEYRLAYNLKYY